MLADDKRHGTYAGYQVHKRTKVPACKPCKVAAAERTAQERARGGRADTKSCLLCGHNTVSKTQTCRSCTHRLKTASQVDEDAALTGGEWARRPGGIYVWEAA